MRQEPSTDRKFQVPEYTFSKLSVTWKGDQSLFRLLLEIESRLRKEFRSDQAERRLKPPGCLSRYRE